MKKFFIGIATAVALSVSTFAAHSQVNSESLYKQDNMEVQFHDLPNTLAWCGLEIWNEKGQNIGLIINPSNGLSIMTNIEFNVTPAETNGYFMGDAIIYLKGNTEEYFQQKPMVWVNDIYQTMVGKDAEFYRFFANAGKMGIKDLAIGYLNAKKEPELHLFPIKGIETVLQAFDACLAGAIKIQERYLGFKIEAVMNNDKGI